MVLKFWYKIYTDNANQHKLSFVHCSFKMEDDILSETLRGTLVNLLPLSNLYNFHSLTLSIPDNMSLIRAKFKIILTFVFRRRYINAISDSNLPSGHRKGLSFKKYFNKALTFPHLNLTYPNFLKNVSWFAQGSSFSAHSSLSKQIFLYFLHACM